MYQTCNRRYLRVIKTHVKRDKIKHENRLRDVEGATSRVQRGNAPRHILVEYQRIMV
jgi:hypothetical protein